MSDIVTGLRQVIQDMVAPDQKAHTTKLDMLQKQVEIQHDALMKTIDAFRAEMRSELQPSVRIISLRCSVRCRR